ncbi:MAG: hypothetical protein QF907_00715 [Nitrospinota bacterium]|nr:hypothetical protein [Nitrospinota bacterium]MDP7581222.1 hypothetical protein [Nitrospinota bacterium]HJN03320.1 hypothetical protein [Nitrospinota bacterium]
MRIIFFILILFIVLYLIFSLLFQSNQKPNENSMGTEMVKDPNCDTFIQKSDAIRRYIKGNYYYFCSSKCVKEFKKK